MCEVGSKASIININPVSYHEDSHLIGSYLPTLHCHYQLAVITGSLAGALPVALASFPQRAEFNASDLEPQFQDLKDASGQRIKKLYTNKGL